MSFWESFSVTSVRELSQETTVDADLTRDEENDRLKYKRLISKVAKFEKSIEDRMKAVEDHIRDFETRLSTISNDVITKDVHRQFGERLKICEDTQTKNYSYLTLKSWIFLDFINKSEW